MNRSSSGLFHGDSIWSAQHSYLPLPSNDNSVEHQQHAGHNDQGVLGSASRPGRAVAYRAKKTRIINWLVLHATGGKQYLRLDKRQLIQFFNLDIPMRDMRFLDPSMLGSASSATAAQGAAQGGSGQLYVRDNAIILALEHVRMIITADKAILPLPDEKSDVHSHFVASLESQLQDRLMMEGGGAVTQQPSLQSQNDNSVNHKQPFTGNPVYPTAHQGTGIWANATGPANLYSAGHHTPVGGSPPQPPLPAMPFQHTCPQNIPGPTSIHGSHSSQHSSIMYTAGGKHGGNGGTPQKQTTADLHEEGLQGGAPTPTGPLSQRETADELAFELHCLESGLGEVCHHLAKEVDVLQAQAMPALEDLISSSDRRNLERVRRVKTSHQRLQTRIAVVRDALHRLLEDDGDMFRMCLSRAQRKLPSTSQTQLLNHCDNNGRRHDDGNEPPTPVAFHPQQQLAQHLVVVPPYQSTNTAFQPTHQLSDMPPSAINLPPIPERPVASQQTHQPLPSQQAGTQQVTPFQTEEEQGVLLDDASPGSSPPGHEVSVGGLYNHQTSGGSGNHELRHSSSGLGLGSPQSKRASLELPDLFVGSAIRSPSLLALKLRHMQHVQQQQQQQHTAIANIAAAASGGMSGSSLDKPSSLLMAPGTPLNPAATAAGATVLDEDDIHDVLDVENLLEAYATMADGTHATLMSLGEYIDDTEDLVNINLDYSRNKIIRLELVITIGTFALAFYSCMAGVLGENLVIPELFTRDVSGFFIINGTLVTLSLCVFFGITAFIKSNKLIS